MLTTLFPSKDRSTSFACKVHQTFWHACCKKYWFHTIALTSVEENLVFIVDWLIDYIVVSCGNLAN